MLYGGPSHLWYCLMLFYCFIICWTIQKKVGDWLNLILMLSSFALTICFVNIWQLWNLHLFPGGWEFVSYYYCYFYLGYTVFKYRDKLIVNSKMSMVYLLLYLIFCCLFRFIPMAKTLMCISYVLLLFSLFNFMSKYKMKEGVSSLINKIGLYSFGIYVFHQFILWNLSHIPFTIQLLKPIVSSNFFISNMLGSLIIFALCYYLSKLSIKTRIGKYLLT